MNRIKEARIAAGLSQKYVAMSLGVAGPSVSNWESGKTKPTPENLKALSDLLHVSIDYLLGVDTPEVSSPAQVSAQAFQQLDPDRTRYAQQLRAREHYGPSYQPPQQVSVSESRTEGASAQYMGEAPRTPAEEAAQIRAYIITQLSDSLQRLSTEHFKQAVDYVALLELKEKVENSAEKK